MTPKKDDKYVDIFKQSAANAAGQVAVNLLTEGIINGAKAIGSGIHEAFRPPTKAELKARKKEEARRSKEYWEKEALRLKEKKEKEAREIEYIVYGEEGKEKSLWEKFEDFFS